MAKFVSAEPLAEVFRGRVAAGWTYGELAELVGLSGRQVERIVRREARMVSFVTADRVALRLGLHPALLFDEWCEPGSMSA